MIQNKESSCCDSHSCGFHSNNFPPAFLSALHYHHLQKMWRLTIGAISFLIILVSIPGNLTIVHYLNEKPPGHQTTVDSVFKDFFLINFTSTLLNGLRYCFLLLLHMLLQLFFHSSIISLCYFGKLTEIIGIGIAWTCLYFNLLTFTSGILASFYRYLFIFRANHLLEMDDL